MVRLLKRSCQEDIISQCIWFVGNFTGTGPRYREIMLELGALEPMLDFLRKSNGLSDLRNALWAACSLTRSRPYPDLDKVSALIDVAAKYLHHSDGELVDHACWTMAYITDFNDEAIHAVVQSGVVHRLVEILAWCLDSKLEGVDEEMELLDDETADGESMKFPRQGVPALRALGNMVTGSDRQTQATLDAGFLTPAKLVLERGSELPKIVLKETLWALSNITAGSVPQIDKVVESGVLDAVPQYLAEGVQLDIVKEASWMVSNMTSGGTIDHLKLILDSSVVEHWHRILLAAATDEEFDVRLIVVMLEGITNLARGMRSMRMRHSPGQWWDRHVAALEAFNEVLISLQANHVNINVSNSSQTALEFIAVITE